MPESPARRWWQFSVREMLLLTAVVALALSHLSRDRPTPGPSPFYERFDPIAWGNAIARQHGFSKQAIGGGGGVEEFQVYGHKRFEFELGPTANSLSREQYVAEVQKLAIQGLAAAKCETISTSTSGSPLTGFFVEYTWRDRRGTLAVHSHPLPNAEYGLIVTLHEARVAK